MKRRPGHPLEGGVSRSDVRAELEHYLEERAREFEAQGLPPAEARKAAEAAFGDVERIENQVRSADGAPNRGNGRWTMGTVLQDLRFALRSAWRRPTTTAVVVLTLGLGIGATTAIFTVVNASMLGALPFAQAQDLVFLQGAYDAPEGPQVRGASYPEAQDWAARSRSFQAMAPFSGASVTLTGVDQAERIATETVGRGYFQVLDVEPLLGRTFDERDHALDGTGQVALLGEDLWDRRFGRDPDVLGRSLTLDGRTFTVVGVLPRTFPGPSLGAQLWIPLEAAGAPIDSRGTRWLGVVGRLRSGTTVEQARADMAGVAAQLEAEFPSEHEDRIAVVRPVREVYLGDTRVLMLVILAATGVLLIIAAANVTNLLLVRAADRRSEMLVRAAMGAGRGRIRGQLLVESLVLSALGAGVGFVVGAWGARGLAAAMPEGLLPAYVELDPDLRVLAFTGLVMALVGLVGGLAPALQASRHDVATGLRQERGSRRPGGWSLQQGLVVAEVALAFLLLVGAGLMARSFLAQLRVDPGFDADRLYAFSLQFPGERYDRAAREAAARDLLDRLEARPEIVAASLANDAPLVSGYSAAYIWTEGSTAEDRIRFYRHHVVPGWFETLGIDLLQGRGFTPADETPVAVISRAMAERHFPGGDPVGRTLRIGGPDGDAIRIIGVSGDVRYRDLTTDLVQGATDPDIFVPWTLISTSSVAVVARTDGDPAALERVVADVVRGVDPDLAIFNAGPLARGLAAATAQGRFGTLLLGLFSGLAVILCALGLYGVLSAAVARRTRELAVRMAVGAPVADLRWMVVRQGMVLLALGLGLGGLAAAGATRALQAFLFQVGRGDPGTWLAVGGLLSAVTLASTWLPALRATRVDPQRALKSD